MDTDNGRKKDMVLSKVFHNPNSAVVVASRTRRPAILSRRMN